VRNARTRVLWSRRLGFSGPITRSTVRVSPSCFAVRVHDVFTWGKGLRSWAREA
jgi:hypothetical protein